jgi:3',5'-cyclic-AMP phosphodiesterase
MGGEAPLRLLQITDFHLRAAPHGEVKGWITQQTLERALAAALEGRPRPDAVLATGDLSQDGSRESYRRLRDTLGDLGVPVLCIPGNHDDPEAMAAELSRPPFRYCGDHGIGRWRLVLLSTWDGDRGGGRLAAGELQRLERTMNKAREPHVLVVLHHHPVPTGSWLDKVALENPDEFYAVLDSCARVRGVVWGHVHQVQDSQRRGMRMLGTPSTCFQFVPGVLQSAVDPQAAPAWRWLELAADGRIASRVEWAGVPARRAL